MPQPNIPDGSPPARATGGCLCGAIRYTVVFPPGHDFVSNVRRPTPSILT